MSARRWKNFVFCLLLVAAVAAGALLTPGFRHRHTGGDTAHSHAHSHSHGHSHGHAHSHAHGHSHSHGHGHTHSHRSNSKSESGSHKATDTTPHIHISFLGIDLTLPDFLGGEAPVTTEIPTPSRRTVRQPAGTVVIHAPVLPAVWVQWSFDFKCLPSTRISVSADRANHDVLMPAAGLVAGIGRAAPAVPPPETT